MNALLKIQAFLSAPKDKKNQHGGYTYRTAEGIIEELKPLLKETNSTLVITDEIVVVGGEIKVELDYNEAEPIVNAKDKSITYPLAKETHSGRVYVKSTATLTQYYEEGVKSYTTWSACGYARECDRKKGLDVAQITGSASSYSKKYALSNLFAIDNGEPDADADADDKDNGAPSAPAKPAPEKPATPASANEPTPEEIQKIRDEAFEMLDTIQLQYPDVDNVVFKLTDKIDTLGKFIGWARKNPTKGKAETYKSALDMAVTWVAQNIKK